MFDLFKRRRRARLRELPLTADQRATLESKVPHLARLTPADRHELAGLIQIFLANRQSYRVMEGANFMQENLPLLSLVISSVLLLPALAKAGLYVQPNPHAASFLFCFNPFFHGSFSL